jgi:MoxR-like ATPase
MTDARTFHAKIDLDQPTPLPQTDRHPTAAHHWSKPERDAVTLALACGRPLLVRGEAGSGKSQLARAVAAEMKTELLEEIIHARFEATDILYRIDTLKRLADAERRHDIQDWTPYIEPGPYWQACTAGKTKQCRVVLLIDEIDKADSDVPNALLDVLANRSFTVPYTKQVVRAEPDFHPLVMFTTNEDRELPAAFVRRCVVLNQNPPDQGKNPATFLAWLLARGRAHSYCRVAEDTRRAAAEMVLEDRKAALEAGYPPVGLAEYVDLLRALEDLAPGDTAAQEDWLKQLRGYALIKNRDQDQQRHAAP